MNAVNPPHRDLPTFVTAVERRAAQVVRNANLPRAQSEVLENCFGTPGPGEFIPHLMAPFYFLIRAHGTPVDSRCEALGTAFALVQRGVSLIDKVTDEELSETWAELGAAVALNSGLTLLVLGIDEVWAAETRNPDVANLRERLMQHLLCASSGQHRELTSRFRVLPTDERIAVSADKASECSLLIELAGICSEAAGASPGRSQLARYRAIGREIGILIQVFNDIADLLGPGSSDDLRTGTWNIPLTTLLNALEPAARARWERTLVRGQGAGKAVIEALYDQGVMASLARRVEQARVLVHEQSVLLPCGGPYLRLFTSWVDDLTSALLPCRAGEPAGVLTPQDALELSGLSDGDETIYRALCACRVGGHANVSTSSLSS